MSLDGDLAVVTGATGGLGFAICNRLIDHGFRVIGVSRRETPEFEKLRKMHPESIFFEEVDLADLGSIRSFASSLTQRYGRSYALINNAGIGNDGLLPTMHDIDIDRIIRVNLQAPILMAKYLCRGMLLNRRGRIINISSIIANTGFSGLSVYGATKAGLIGFSKSLSRELGKAGITVNCVAPGYMETKMTNALSGDNLASVRRRSPLSRFPTTREVAGAVAYLLSDEAAAVIGAVVTVDAGSTA